MLFTPPVTSTFPFPSNVAVCQTRSVSILPVGKKPLARIWTVGVCGAEFWLAESWT